MYLKIRGNLAGLGIALALGQAVPALHAADVEDSLEVVARTNRAAAQSQQKIDQLARQTQDLLEEYRQLQDGSDYQASYTRELQELELAQRAQIESLQQQIVQARVTRQRILPLMRSMADALEKFVVLDLPFRHEERINAVLQLKQRLNQSELSMAARFRLLLEAYQLEQDYGGKIEAWRGPLEYEGKELSVEYLRVGRAALYFLSLDGETSGFWNARDAAWVGLQGDHNRALAQAMRVARKLSAPQLLQLPMIAPDGDA